MTVENKNEIWQVEVAGKIYEAPLGELPEWIGEGSLQPEDKVRKGNLRWIEARKVPALIPFFNARAKGERAPMVQSVTDASSVNTPPADGQPKVAETDQHPDKSDAALSSATSDEKEDAARRRRQIPGRCANHPYIAAAYVCSTCESEFCKTCPTSYGGSVRTCPECGSMCKTAAEISKKASISAKYDDKAFGMADFSRALAYPFKFRNSLVFGGGMFMLFTVGQSAGWIGNIFLVVGAIFCFMLANMLTFGILANTVENFAKGRLDVDFMPSFEDFSLWDDVVHPLFLSIGVYLSSFGLFLLIAIIGFYMIVNAAGEQMKKFNDELARVPGTPLYAPNRTFEQSQDVKDVLDKVKRQNERRLADQQRAMEEQALNAESGTAAPMASQPMVSDPEAELADLEKTLNEARARQLESVTGPADPTANYKEMVASIVRLAAPLFVIGAIAFIWGLFYFPAACAVAGYSRLFMATINPLVGLDTVKRLGVTYVKILLIGLVILLASGFVALILQAMLSPFALPRLGNIPATMVGALFSFYFWAVFSCVLGYALFKKADRLKLYR